VLLQTTFSSQDIDLEQIIRIVNVPAQLKAEFDDAMITGVEAIVSPGTHKVLLQHIDRGGPLADRIAAGVADLASSAWRDTAVATHVAALATVVLVRAIWDFLCATGELEDAGEPALIHAIERSVRCTLAAAGVNPFDADAVWHWTKARISTNATAHAGIH
jgi:hypothetical protein